MKGSYQLSVSANLQNISFGLGGLLLRLPELKRMQILAVVVE